MSGFSSVTEYEVSTTAESWSGKHHRAKNLGHGIHMCGHCRKGAFRVKNALDHDEKCDECGYWVFVRRVDL